MFDQVQNDLAAATIVNERDDALDLLAAALEQFLDASADNPDVQQILLIDGPAVLGWDQWRTLEARYGLGVITSMLEAAVAQKVIPRQPTGSLAHMLRRLSTRQRSTCESPRPSTGSHPAQVLATTRSCHEADTGEISMPDAHWIADARAAPALRRRARRRLRRRATARSSYVLTQDIVERAIKVLSAWSLSHGRARWHRAWTRSSRPSTILPGCPSVPPWRGHDHRTSFRGDRLSCAHPAGQRPGKLVAGWQRYAF